ncbi:MAG: flavin reductase [Planctomycetes bacterium]|nr:flavin reductase [Planctomycetota bacterium]
MSAHPNKNLSGDMALAYLPAGRYVLTSAYDGARAGVLVHWVQPCAEEPALLAVAAKRGHCVEPLIRDSRAFAICVLRSEDRLLVRKFQSPHPPDETTDPFDSLDVETFSTGSPVLTRSVVAYDCEVVRHFDLEADHELYIGQIVAACVYDPSAVVGPMLRTDA